jgi:hypothetical protein
VGLREDVERVGELARAYAAPGESLAGVLATEPVEGRRIYLCAFADEAGGRSWVAVDDGGTPVTSRSSIRDAVSIAALCELAEETAAGGDLEELRAQLAGLRLTEGPPGIEEAEEAALELERTIGTPPRLATPTYLDAVGLAARRLEQALGENGSSPFANAMKQGLVAVDELTAEVEGRYKLELT